MLLRQPKDLGQPLNSVYGLKYIWWNFSIIGINPPPDTVKFRWRFLYFLYAVVIILLGAFCLPITMLINIRFVATWQELIGNLSLSITIAVSTFKEAALVYHRKRLLRSQHYLHQLDERCNPHPIERMHILQAIRNCHIAYVLYISFYALCANGFSYIGWTNGQLVYNAWFPNIFNDAKKNYMFAFMYQSFAQYHTVFQNGTNDMYPLCYISLMIAHTRALGERIKRMGMDKSQSQEDNVKELRNCIQDHKNVQNFFDCIRPVISTTLFMQFFITSFVLCMTAINLIAFNRNIAEKVFSILYLSIILIQVFPSCMFVNILMQETSYLTTAMYSCNWIEQNRNFRKMLIIFMQRSQKQNVINAGDLAPVTLQTFLSIIKFSFSMFTILSQMKINE